MRCSFPLRKCLPALAAIVLGASGWGAEELVKEAAKRDAEVAKAQQIYDAALAVANDRAIKIYIRLAQRDAKSGDVAGAVTVWKEVLRLDRKQPEAIAYFTALGTLEPVLAELDDAATDLIGAPLAGVAGPAAGGGRAVLVFGDAAGLVPSGDTTLTTSFAARTTEVIVGKVTGDGVLFEEGGSGNGQAIGVVGNEVHYVTRSAGTPCIITAPFDRAVAWTQVVVQFNAGDMRLWLNGKLAAKGKANVTVIGAHGGGGLGRGDGANSGGWTQNCQFLLRAMRLSDLARYTDQAGPNGHMDTDKNTVLAITPETIAAELATLPRGSVKGAAPILLSKVAGSLPASLVWTASGALSVR